MSSPKTLPELREAVAEALQHKAHLVASMSTDSGFVAKQTLAGVVNIQSQLSASAVAIARGPEGVLLLLDSTAETAAITSPVDALFATVVSFLVGGLAGPSACVRCIGPSASSSVAAASASSKPWLPELEWPQILPSGWKNEDGSYQVQLQIVNAAQAPTNSDVAEAMCSGMPLPPEDTQPKVTLTASVVTIENGGEGAQALDLNMSITHKMVGRSKHQCFTMQVPLADHVVASDSMAPSAIHVPFIEPRQDTITRERRGSHNSIDSTGSSKGSKLRMPGFRSPKSKEKKSAASTGDTKGEATAGAPSSSTAAATQEWEHVGIVITNVAQLEQICFNNLVAPLLDTLGIPTPRRNPNPDVGAATSASATPGASASTAGADPNTGEGSRLFIPPVGGRHGPPGRMPRGGIADIGGPGGFGDDLLPGGGLGSGGMLFGPGNPYFDQRMGPRGGGRGGFGPGGFGPGGRGGMGGGPAPGVPPGARFDPYGPPIAGNYRGNPNPDHLRPPGGFGDGDADGDMY